MIHSHKAQISAGFWYRTHKKLNIIIAVKGKKCLNSEKSFKMTHLYYYFFAILNPFVF